MIANSPLNKVLSVIKNKLVNSKKKNINNKNKKKKKKMKTLKQNEMPQIPQSYIIFIIGHNNFDLGIVACSCNQATLELKFWNSVGSVPARGS